MKTYLLAFALHLGFVASATFSASPNIVLVLADDLGYGDLGCYGSQVAKTPNLDRFASEGLRLTQCYAANGNCSPSRTALMTGRTPMRAGIRTAIPLGSPMHVGRHEVTIASLLKKIGYNTCHVGKWHMNGQFNLPTQPQPGDHGFEHWFSTQNNALPNHRHPNNFVRNGKEVGPLEGYASQLVVDEAVRWLDEGRDPNKPFFLYVCFHEPHEPIATDERFRQLYPSADPSYSAFYGNIAQMDDGFGRLMKALDERSLRDETFVFFTSDNGPAITPMHPHGSAGSLRDKKGSLWEGGIRVPGILRWPGRARAGSTIDEPVCGVDFLPTVCDITGATPPTDRVIDGTSLVPLLDGQPLLRQRPLFWYFPKAIGPPKVALRRGDWKILASWKESPTANRSNDINDDSERQIKEAELDQFFLYNLREDIGETTDRSATAPELFDELKKLLQKTYEEVRRETPTWPHWKFVNEESQRIEWPEYARPPGKLKSK